MLSTALKILTTNKILTLTKIIYCCLRAYYFPPAKESETIFSIPKPGKNHNLPESYQPIALLSSLSKVYERIVLDYLKLSLSDKIRPEMFAFLPEHSTSLLITNILNKIANSLNHNIHTATVFLDVKKAFIKVWLTILFISLKFLFFIFIQNY